MHIIGFESLIEFILLTLFISSENKLVLLYNDILGQLL